MESPRLLLLLCGLITLARSQVDVDLLVSGNRGQQVTLRCIYEGAATPVSIVWQKIIGGSAVRIAIALTNNYLIDNTTDLYGRLNFTNLDSNLRNGSVRIEDLRLGDEGTFICAFATLTSAEATIILTVNVPPHLSLEPNPAQLVEGTGLVAAATCVAQSGKPAANVSWTGVAQGGANETEATEEADGTVTVSSSYWLEPSYEMHGRTLTCHVGHPALGPALQELSTTLNIHYQPRVSVAGYNADWFVGKLGAQLTCDTDANPAVTRHVWSRDGGSVPSGALEAGPSLLFERPLTESDSGNFSCRANNSVGWGEDAVSVAVGPGTSPAPETSSVGPGTSPAPETSSAATRTAVPTVPTVPTSPGGSQGTDSWVIAVAVTVPLLVLAIAVGTALYCRHRRHKGSRHTDSSNVSDGVTADTPGQMPPRSGASAEHVKLSVEPQNRALYANSKTEYAEISPTSGEKIPNGGGQSGRLNVTSAVAAAAASRAGTQKTPQAKAPTVYAELNTEMLTRGVSAPQRALAGEPRPKPGSVEEGPESCTAHSPTSFDVGEGGGGGRGGGRGGGIVNSQQALTKTKPPVAPKPQNSRRVN